MTKVEWAEAVARQHLADHFPRRWTHTRGVAAQARTLASILGDNADLVLAAAWLHDIGYTPALVQTGFHPLDGALYLRDTEHADNLLCRLVAHHSEAIFEAAERHLETHLRTEFDPPPQPLANALTYCDMTTAPDGTQTSVEDRIHEVTTRYGPEHAVTRAMTTSRPRLLQAAADIANQLFQQPLGRE